MKSILKLCTQVLGYISIYTFHFNPHWSQFGHTASLKNDKLTYSQNGTFNSKIIFDKKNRFWTLGIRIRTQSLWKLSLTKKFPNSLLPVYDSSVKTCQISYNHIYSSPKKYWQVRQPLPFLSPRHNMIPFSEVLLSLGDFFLWDKSNKRSSVWV